MVAQLVVFAAAVALAHAGFLSAAQGGTAGSYGGVNFGGGQSSGSGDGANYYNSAPLALNPGPLPSTQSQAAAVAPLRYAPGPPLASSTSFRHQISISHPQVVEVPVALGSYGQSGGSGGGRSGAFAGGSGNGATGHGYPHYGGY